MKIIGLTGSIGMGKSTLAAMIERLNIPVFDADKAVHLLQGKGGGAVKPLADHWPNAIIDGAVDRKILSAIVQKDPTALKQLEAIIHPLVREQRQQFLKKHALRHCQMVVLDIPLLFETGYDDFCDYSLTVYCSDMLQEHRVLSRPNMTVEKLAFIRSKQMPAAEKVALSDYAINTDQGRRPALEQLKKILKQIKQETLTRRDMRMGYWD